MLDKIPEENWAALKMSVSGQALWYCLSPIAVEASTEVFWDGTRLRVIARRFRNESRSAINAMIADFEHPPPVSPAMLIEEFKGTRVRRTTPRRRGVLDRRRASIALENETPRRTVQVRLESREA